MSKRRIRDLTDGYFVKLPLELAAELGINAALVLTCIHYWLEISTNVVDGEKWVYDTYDSLYKKLKGALSARTIQRCMLSLEERGIIVSRRLDYRSRRKWYRIDYSKIPKVSEIYLDDDDSDAKTEENIVPDCHDPSCQIGTMIVPNWHDDSAKLARSIYTKNTAENTAGEAAPPEPTEKRAEMDGTDVMSKIPIPPILQNEYLRISSALASSNLIRADTLPYVLLAINDVALLKEAGKVDEKLGSAGLIIHKIKEYYSAPQRDFNQEHVEQLRNHEPTEAEFEIFVKRVHDERYVFANELKTGATLYRLHNAVGRDIYPPHMALLLEAASLPYSDVLGPAARCWATMHNDLRQVLEEIYGRDKVMTLFEQEVPKASIG